MWHHLHRGMVCHSGFNSLTDGHHLIHHHAERMTNSDKPLKTTTIRVTLDVDRQWTVQTSSMKKLVTQKGSFSVSCAHEVSQFTLYFLIIFFTQQLKTVPKVHKNSL